MTPTEIVMPQMGESVAEGTIVRWLKQVGDSVERDEPLFEISTDKVDAEIPSPTAGVVTEIRAREGETVLVNTVVAIVTPVDAPATSVAPAPSTASAVVADVAVTGPVRPTSPATSGSPRQAAGERLSPLVRKMAKEHGIDLSTVSGTGGGGRVTKHDLLAFLDSPRPPAPAAARPRVRAASVGDAVGTGMAGRSAPMSVMRRQIAEHMLVSLRTSAHVYSVFEIDFGRVDEIRQARKADYERQGAKLTYLPFIIKAAASALRAVPVVNASVDGDRIVYHEAINIGIAVALDWGLIVPVVKEADAKSLLEVSQTVVDLADRARAKHLTPDEVLGGTFTITNAGVGGSVAGMPIINQPQVAIAAVGAIQKRVTVVGNAAVIRPMAYLTLGFDHRIIDGAVADEFLQHVRHAIEHWDPANT